MESYFTNLDLIERRWFPFQKATFLGAQNSCFWSWWNLTRCLSFMYSWWLSEYEKMTDLVKERGPRGLWGPFSSHHPWSMKTRWLPIIQPSNSHGTAENFVFPWIWDTLIDGDIAPYRYTRWFSWFCKSCGLLSCSFYMLDLESRYCILDWADFMETYQSWYNLWKSSHKR